MKLSVVVPVYKVEDSLQKCVESILCQEVSDMEVILVDDGSPDGCPRLCNAIADKDNRVKVIHKKNGGLSSARNAGIEIAKGEYITFVDSDDYLQEGSYKTIMEILEEHKEYDILEFPVLEFHGSSKEHLLTFSNTVYNNATEYWLQGRAYAHTYAWNKFYKRNLFDSVKYPEGIVFEDVWTMPKLLEKVKCIATCDKGLYVYCLNDNGITRTAGGKEWQMLLDAHITALKSMNLPQGKELLRYYMHVVNTQIQTYDFAGGIVTLPKIKIGREIFSYLSANDVTIQSKIKCIIIKIFNLTTLCRLISRFQKRQADR